MSHTCSFEDLRQQESGLYRCSVCGKLYDLQLREHACYAHPGRDLETLAFHKDWDDHYSSQSHGVYRCKKCGRYWSIRWQWDAGSGRDDHWTALTREEAEREAAKMSRGLSE